MRRRGSLADPVSEDDIRRALAKLRVLGGGLDLVTIGAAAYVRSVPGELNLDKNRALELAQVRGGGVVGGWEGAAPGRGRRAKAGARCTLAGAAARLRPHRGPRSRAPPRAARRAARRRARGGCRRPS
jgi:hypothetical protein